MDAHLQIIPVHETIANRDLHVFDANQVPVLSNCQALTACKAMQD